MDRPKPVPSAGEVLVKVVKASLCHTDVIIRVGLAGHVRYPVVPGHEFAGVVESCGDGVKRIKPGDRVGVQTVLACGQCSACRNGDNMACENYDELGSKRDGGFAEYCAIPERNLYLLPDHVSLEEGALLEPLANAVSAVRQAGIKCGERVVVIGPGPVGLLAVQVAKLANPSVVVLVGTRDERLALGKSLGADEVVNIKQAESVDLLKRMLKGKGADVVIECAGNAGSMELAMDILGWRGRIAVEGIFGTQETVAISPYQLLLCRAATIVGVCGWLISDFNRALDLISTEQVDCKPLITHTFPLDQWEAAFDMITKRRASLSRCSLLFNLSWWIPPLAGDALFDGKRNSRGLDEQAYEREHYAAIPG